MRYTKCIEQIMSIICVCVCCLCFVLFSAIARWHSSYFSIISVLFFTTFIVLLFAWFYGIILCNVVRLHSLDFHTFAVSRCAFELISARWVCFFSFFCCCDFCCFFRTLHIANDIRAVCAVRTCTIIRIVIFNVVHSYIISFFAGDMLCYRSVSHLLTINKKKLLTK